MDFVSKSSITRLARKAGIKSLSNNSFPILNGIMDALLIEVLDTSLIVTSEHNTKTLMTGDIYTALRISGYNVAESSELGTITYSK